MNTERTVVLENVGDCPIGLADTQRRMYRLAKGAKMRISAVTLQDILDHPGSRAIFNEGMAKVSNITADELYQMGLTEKEIKKYLIASKQPTIVITKTIEKEDKEEEIITIEEPKEEKVEEEPKEEKPVAAKKTTPKKTTAKKTTSKKTK